MKIRSLFLLTIVSPLHAGELIPSQIATSAKWQVHADLDAMRESDTGKSLFRTIESEHGAKLRAAKRMFSIHPLTDLRGITLYGDGKPDHAVALIDGKFDRAHLEDIVKAADDYESTDYDGVTVHIWTDKGAPQYAAFTSDQLLVFSHQRSMLNLALDTLKSPRTAEPDAFLGESGESPLLSASARLSEMNLPGDEARIVGMAKVLRLAANEHDERFTLRSKIDATTAANAGILRRILDGVVAFAQVSDPKLEGLDLRSAFTTTAETLSGTLSLPTPEWISLMEKAAAEKANQKPE